MVSNEQNRNREMDTWSRVTAVKGDRGLGERRHRQQCGGGQREGGGERWAKGEGNQDICNSANNKKKSKKKKNLKIMLIYVFLFISLSNIGQYYPG